MAGVAVAVAVAVAVVVVFLVLSKLLLGHMLNYADFKCLKSRNEALWRILCRVVGYCHTLSCNIALNAHPGSSRAEGRAPCSAAVSYAAPPCPANPIADTFFESEVLL